MIHCLILASSEERIGGVLGEEGLDPQSACCRDDFQNNLCAIDPAGHCLGSSKRPWVIGEKSGAYLVITEVLERESF